MFCLDNSTCLPITTGTAPQTFAAALQYFAAAQCLLKGDTLPQAEVPNFKSFDFIIIGGGTSGNVVARRLTEGGWKILLLEAGGDPPIESDVPGFDSDLVDSEYSWKYVTANNSVIDQAIINGSINLSTGKMFGGSSSLNDMAYIRGNDHDFQSWNEDGNEHWSLRNIRRCFKNAESLQNQEMVCDPDISSHYGYEGPLAINKFNNTLKSTVNGVLKAWHKIGFTYVSDLNAAGLFGSGVVPVTAADGIRQSTNRAYLIPVSHKDNLKILKNAFVRKILISKNTNVAFGVEVEKNGKVMTFYSNHEIILSAGAVNSPQLLMLSGIGPKEYLQSKNITCLFDSPMVGQNLQDHLAVPLTVYTDEEKVQEKYVNGEEEFDIIKYILDRRGNLARSSIMTDITAFYATKRNVSSPECRIQVMIKPKKSKNLEKTLATTYRYKKPIVDSIVETNKNHDLYFFVISLLHPYSRGNVSLRSNNPRDAPLVFPNYFSDMRDLQTAVKGLKMASKTVGTKFFRENSAFLGRMKWPECDREILGSHKYWECICLNMVTSLSDLVGTCKMGSDPKTSVVNNELKVHGITHLRVIDASVMPKITSGDATAPSIMIGERGAELIKKEYDSHSPEIQTFMEQMRHKFMTW